jgi:hypothetical protein
LTWLRLSDAKKPRQPLDCLDFGSMPLTGIEPVRYRYRGILSPLRLPVPPQRHNICIVAQEGGNVNLPAASFCRLFAERMQKADSPPDGTKNSPSAACAFASNLLY